MSGKRSRSGIAALVETPDFSEQVARDISNINKSINDLNQKFARYEDNVKKKPALVELLVAAGFLIAVAGAAMDLVQFIGGL